MTSLTLSSSTRPAFWRIQNINTSEKDAAIEWSLTQTKELAISESQGFIITCVSERTLYATLTSRKLPTPSNRRWRIDKSYIGLTPLHISEDANVDIVAVTGLGGHALGSFRSSDDISVWLRDSAPQDIPRALLFIYNYDTAIVASVNCQGVREIANTLLDGLVNLRQRTQTQHRPLIFARDFLVRPDGKASQCINRLTSECSNLRRRRSLLFEIIAYYETVSSTMVVVSVACLTFIHL
jgi:hypothetical protein